MVKRGGGNGKGSWGWREDRGGWGGVGVWWRRDGEWEGWNVDGGGMGGLEGDGKGGKGGEELLCPFIIPFFFLIRQKQGAD